MARVEEVVNAVLAAVESDAGPDLVAGWCSERYRELTNRASFRHLLQEHELVMPAMVDDGTVTATSGSAVLVGNAAARTAWAALGTEIDDGRFVRIDGQRNWFRIAGVSGSGPDLLLTTPYVAPFDGAPSVAGSAYKLVKRFHVLPNDVRAVKVVSHLRLLTPLEEVSHQELDLTMTSRVLVADIPRYWAECERADDGSPQIELYPYARTDQLIRYTAMVHAPELTLDSTLPPDLDLHTLKAGALVDVYRWEMAKALRQAQPEVAATWRNEMNTQITRWEGLVREAIKQGRISQTVSLQLNTQGFPASDDKRIRNAYDYVWQRANRP